jgi:hypothetical protein
MNEKRLESLIERGQDVVRRLLVEQEIANASWAQFTALHRVNSDNENGLKNTLQRLCLYSGLRSLADALIRDTLLALFRMTDDPGNNRITLCVISKLLSDAALQEERVSWLEQCPIPSGDICHKKIKFISELVPPRWGPNIIPKDKRLSNFRLQLQPIRNKLIAHAQPFESLKIALRSVEDFRSLVEELVLSAQFIFRGAAGIGTFEARSTEAEEFWSYIVQGFLAERSRSHTHKRDSQIGRTVVQAPKRSLRWRASI